MKMKMKRYYGYFILFNNEEKLFCQTIHQNRFSSLVELFLEPKAKKRI
jgi:hypothetical protein